MVSQTMDFMLTRNPFKDDGSYIARVVNQRGISFEALLLEMENNTAIRKQDLRLAITQFFNSIADNLSKGLKVQTPVGEFKPTIRGSFDSLDEDFRPKASTNNHELKVIMRPNPNLVNSVVDSIKTEKIMAYSVKQPHAISVVNSTQPEDGGFHSGNVLIIRGINLKFDPEHEDEGLFWVNDAGESVRTTSFSVSTGSNMHCQIPELDAGEYNLRIATRLGNHQLRDSIVEEPITVS